jgi:hypothetical protein
MNLGSEVGGGECWGQGGQGLSAGGLPGVPGGACGLGRRTWEAGLGGPGDGFGLTDVELCALFGPQT